MKAISIKEIKEELQGFSPVELREICLRLARFKKENKELLTYILFESANEAAYIEGIKKEVDTDFRNINRSNFHLIKKSLRKILKNIRKYSRYSLRKETEVELLVHFCRRLAKFRPSVRNNPVLQNIYSRQIQGIRKKLTALHEDLQFDYNTELDELGRIVSHKPD